VTSRLPGAFPVRYVRRLTRPRRGAVGATAACQRRRVHTRHMGRIIGTVLGAILAVWLAVTAASGIFASLKTFLVIGLIAMAVFIVVWLVAATLAPAIARPLSSVIGRPRRLNRAVGRTAPTGPVSVLAEARR
jgi:predicted lipid-binding transport protein (Tim44 family)